MDMVCEKNSDVIHDFENDPIETYIDGEWVRARGTTLGADNGIGMAASLAVLASDNLQHGPLEALFTVDEETGLTGAFGMKEGFISGDYLLNLDSEDEAEIFIGCAGGIDTTSTFTYKPTMTPADYFYFRVSISNLQGGHSGSDINKGLGNAIPREASAIIGVPKNEKEKIRVDLNLFHSIIEEELSAVEPNMKITMESEEHQDRCIDRQTTFALINALNACPHGVISMSRDIPGLVETSTNLASVKMVGEDQIVVATSQRSSVESLKQEIACRVESVFTLAGYPGWKPNLKSEILNIAVAAYEELYHVTPEVKAIHAGLECGLFLTKYPHLDMISFGPTLRGVHSPDEKMHIPAVEKFWNHLVMILKKVSEK